MKKVLQVLGFALVAMMLFAGCGKKDKWGDVDQPVTEITFSDGTWEADMEEVDSSSSPTVTTESYLKFTVANNKCSAVEGYTEISGAGQSYKQNLTTLEINFMQDLSTENFLTAIGSHVGGIPAAKEFKTNEEKTKYRYTNDENDVEVTATFVKVE